MPLHKIFHHNHGIAIVCVMVAMLVFQPVRRRIRAKLIG